MLEQLLGWWRVGQPWAMATVVATWRSAPRQPGAVLLVGPDSTVVGSVSGGCVEADVVELAEAMLASSAPAAAPPALRRYGVADADAVAVGLPCGGELEVVVEVVSPRTHPELGLVLAAIAAGEPVALATVVEHEDPARRGRRLLVRPGEVAARIEGVGPGLGSERADTAATDDIRGLLAAGRSELLTYGPDGERSGTGMRVFAATFAPSPRMLVFGASDYAAAVARLGRFLGYRVTVCDARGRFATPARFPEADEVVLDWPHRYLAAEVAAGRVDDHAVLCVLTHDPKFDLPLLEVALRLPVAYVGALGSRRTHEDRLERLREAGLSPAELGRLASPMGLDLGARTPEETAVSIAAEIVAHREGGQGRPLREIGGPIHHPI